jgi:hypothetical protein
MIWQVTAHVGKPLKMGARVATYDGKGSKGRSITRLFKTQVEANRWAKDIVEDGPCWFAKVEAMGKEGMR